VENNLLQHSSYSKESLIQNLAEFFDERLFVPEKNWQDVVENFFDSTNAMFLHESDAPNSDEAFAKSQQTGEAMQIYKWPVENIASIKIENLDLWFNLSFTRFVDGKIQMGVRTSTQIHPLMQAQFDKLAKSCQSTTN
jgi:hypothetical protein